MIRDPKQNIVYSKENMNEQFVYSQNPYTSKKVSFFYYPYDAGYDDIFSLRYKCCSKFVYPFWVIGYSIKSKLYQISSVIKSMSRRRW